MLKDCQGSHTYNSGGKSLRCHQSGELSEPLQGTESTNSQRLLQGEGRTGEDHPFIWCRETGRGSPRPIILYVQEHCNCMIAILVFSFSIEYSFFFLFYDLSLRPDRKLCMCFCGTRLAGFGVPPRSHM